MLRILLLFIAIAASIPAWRATAQRTTRGGRTQVARSTAAADTKQRPADTDTVVAPEPGAVVFTGYDKTLNSTRESLFVSNNGTATLSWLLLTIDYLDPAGRQLHRRTVPVACDIPAGQTRRIDIASWDRQGVYFYRGSEPRRRVTAAASPYTVTLSADSVAMRKDTR
ncbi:MAG: hypothetical protein K2F97_08920 [Muribaculaceae bacterium]|nr:hypothetical protein [Muribaculaceae bacterium]MDE6486742.1 hypothetical protein [Muribaculaceae bacterium]